MTKIFKLSDINKAINHMTQKKGLWKSNNKILIAKYKKVVITENLM